MQPAHSGRRLAAILIDMAAMAILTVISGRLVVGLGMDSSLALGVATGVLPPLTFLACWLIGNTPGKKLLGLRIVDEKTGDAPSVWQLVRRSLLFTFYITFNLLTLIPMLVTNNRKTFHDLLAGTVVVDG